MDLYNHLIFAGLAIAIAIGFTNWYKLGRAFALPLFTFDLIVHIFVQFDIVRIIIAILTIGSITGEIATKKMSVVPPKTKLLGGLLFTVLGAAAWLISPYPYFLIAGLVILGFGLYQHIRNKT